MYAYFRQQMDYSKKLAGRGDYEGAIDIAKDAMRLADLLGDKSAQSEATENWYQIVCADMLQAENIVKKALCK